VNPVTALFWSAATERWRVRRRILLYLTRLHEVKPFLGGGDLLSMGYARGPRIGIILEELKMQRLDGLLKTREDEAEYVLTHFPSEENKGE
jgi:tRNA nucleotidyltransferase (CCA-adding enzyme)